MDIISPLLILKKYSTSDFEDFCKVICNDEVMLHISGKGHTRLVAKEKFDLLLKTNQEHDFYGIYKVVLKETNKMIGFAKITPFEKKCIEIGYALLPPYWRMGYTIEMIKTLTKHGLNYFPEKKLMAIVNEENIASVNVLEKNGYQVYKKENFKDSPCLLLAYANL
ncbi:MAG: GNAT family N-acetyltransferase [Flavobacteriales bacterium]|jgi:RimJ/RimL family protein N-acetyltransferase|tara:strand:- start:1253 stop:1750 length:498 start_codon:yes stop_codon:yes gene_type:complete